MNRNYHLSRALVANGLIVLSTVLLNVIDIIKGSISMNLGNIEDVAKIKTFTVSSNIFAAVISLIFIIVAFKCVFKKENLPYWIIRLRYISTCLLTLVFITVALFLSPYYMTYGHTYFELFTGNNTFFHLLNPLVSLYSLLILENQYAISKKDCIYPVIITISYSVLYLLEVVVFKRWPDFYGMTFGGKLYLGAISIVVIALAIYLISSLIRLIYNKLIKN